MKRSEKDLQDKASIVATLQDGPASLRSLRKLGMGAGRINRLIGQLEADGEVSISEEGAVEVVRSDVVVQIRPPETDHHENGPPEVVQSENGPPENQTTESGPVQSEPDHPSQNGPLVDQIARLVDDVRTAGGWVEVNGKNLRHSQSLPDELVRRCRQLEGEIVRAAHVPGWPEHLPMPLWMVDIIVGFTHGVIVKAQHHSCPDPRCRWLVAVSWTDPEGIVRWSCPKCGRTLEDLRTPAAGVGCGSL